MKKNLGMILLALALVNFACADVITTKEADFRSGPGTEGKQRGKLEDRHELSQNYKSDERYNVQITDGKPGGITKFEKVPADEEFLIKDMAAILQEKMTKDYAAGQTKRDAHLKNLGFLQAEFIVEPNIPAELKVGIFKLPQTYPAWVRISSASGKVQSDKVKDLRGFAIKNMGVQGERYKTQNEEKKTQDFILIEPASSRMEATPRRVRFVAGKSPKKVRAEKKAIFDLVVKYDPFYKAIHNGAQLDLPDCSFKSKYW